MHEKMFWEYEFKTQEYQNSWRCLTNNTFENMELYYRKQLTMQQILIYFRKAFGIAPITLKESNKDKHYKHKLLALYLLTKYSKETFAVIASEFKISLDTVFLINSNNLYKKAFHDEIKLFFKQFEDNYLLQRKASLGRCETIKYHWQDDLKKIYYEKLLSRLNNGIQT